MQSFPWFTGWDLRGKVEFIFPSITSKRTPHPVPQYEQTDGTNLQFIVNLLFA